MRAYIFFPYKAICGHIYGICGHIYGSAGIYMASAGIYIIYMPADPYICPQMPYICPHMTCFEGYIHQYSPQAWILWISKLCIVGGFWEKKKSFFVRNISGIYIYISHSPPPIYWNIFLPPKPPVNLTLKYYIYPQLGYISWHIALSLGAIYYI